MAGTAHSMSHAVLPQVRRTLPPLCNSRGRNVCKRLHLPSRVGTEPCRLHFLSIFLTFMTVLDFATTFFVDDFAVFFPVAFFICAL